MSVYEANILVRIGLDSGTKRYARSDVIGDQFYEGRVVGFEEISREISVLPRDIRISEIVVSLDNYGPSPQRTGGCVRDVSPAGSHHPHGRTW